MALDITEKRTRTQTAAEEQRKNQMDEMFQALEKGVQDVFSSDKFEEYLKSMSRFHNYSVNNQLLIYMQKPDATHVAGYNAWQKSFDRHVLRGAKSIKILAPCPFSVEVDKLDPATQKPILNSDGEVVKEKIEKISFKPVSVFDVSQTDGKPLPKLAENLKGSLDNAAEYKSAIIAISPCPINFEKIPGSANGYCMGDGSKIVVKEGLSDTQTVKTMIHELAHRNIHCIPEEPSSKTLNQDKKSRQQKELEAESTAFIVCRYFGIDTSEYSFGYVAGWSCGKSQEMLRESLTTIQATSSNIIDSMEKELKNSRKKEVVSSISDIISASKNSSSEAVSMQQTKTR